MIEAIFGLVGVVIGGVLTGGINYFLESRREQRAIRAAARLVKVELGVNHHELTNLRVAEKWLSDRPFSTKEWNKHRDLLASALSVDAWDVITKAYDEIFWVMFTLERVEPELELCEFDIKLMELHAIAVGKAIIEMNKITGSHEELSNKWGYPKEIATGQTNLTEGETAKFMHQI